MIDRNVFSAVWAKLCRRFSRKLEMEELDDYLAYLDASGMGTEQFVAASEACWATREFFPRPADFLAGEAASGWTALLKAQRKIQPHMSVEAWKEVRATIPDRAWEALDTLGGLDAIKNAKDLTYVRREYLHAFEARIQEEAMTIERPALPPRQRIEKPALASGPTHIGTRVLEMAGKLKVPT